MHFNLSFWRIYLCIGFATTFLWKVDDDTHLFYVGIVNVPGDEEHYGTLAIKTLILPFKITVGVIT